MSIKTSGLARTVGGAFASLATAALLITPFAAFAAPAAAPAPCDTVGSTIITVTQNVTEPDSGSNGDWANDKFTENVNIWQAADGTFCASGNTTNGTFTTTGPNSPGGAPNNNDLSAGITGTLTGGETWIFPAGTATTTPSTTVSAPDDNSPSDGQFNNWQQYVFNSNGTGVGASGYSFTYVTANHGTWTNADTGSQGDIKNESTPAAPASPSTVTVTPSNTQGWTEVSTDATSTIVADSSHTGNGALQLTTSSNDNSVTHYYSPALSIPLDSVSKLSYDTKQVSAAAQTVGNATLRISLNLAGTGTTVDDQLMYEPYYNGFNGSTGWNTWTITPSSGKMWSNEGSQYNGKGNGGPGGYGPNDEVTLNDVLHDYPNAKIVGVGVTMGSYNDSQVVLADDVNIAAQASNVTYDFEQDAPAPVPTGCVSGCAGTSGGGGGGSSSVSSNNNTSSTNTGTGSVLGASTGPGEVLGASTYNFTTSLTIGSNGADVIALQQFLIANGYSIPAGATGYFGAQTKAAVMAFQKANGLPATGYVGPLTIALLDKGTIETNPMMSTNPMSDSARKAALALLASILQQALAIQAEISAMAASGS